MCQNCRLRNNKKSFILKRDLHGRLAKKERVVAAAGLHRHKARLAHRLLPRLVARRRIKARHRLARARRHDGPALHRLAVYRRGRQIEPHFCALLALLHLHQHAVPDHDELFIVADHE